MDHSLETQPSPFHSLCRWAVVLLLYAGLLAPQAVEAGRYSGGSGRSYSSSGSSAKSSSPSPSPSRPAAPTYSTPRSSYSAGQGSATSSSFSRPTPAPQARPNTTVDAAAARAMQVQQSKQNLAATKAAQQPPPLPSAPAPQYGPQYVPQQNTAVTQSSFGVVPRTSYTARRSHHTTHSGSYYPAYQPYHGRPSLSFGDGYSLLFWYWLLDQPRTVRTEWLYNHEGLMDPARKAAMLAADPALQQSLTEIPTRQPVRNPAYTPPGIEPAAMTSDSPLTVQAAAALTTGGGNLNSNPTPPPPAVIPLPQGAAPLPRMVSHTTHAPAYTRSKSSGWFSWLLLLSSFGLVLWLVFFKRWKPSGSVAA